jgi:hypothetical protein
MRDSNDEVQAFANRYRLKTQIDTDGTKIVEGRFGHLYSHDRNMLGVLIMPNPPRRQYWGFVRSALLKTGFTVVQDGDLEGCATFDPKNLEQAKLAIKVAGVKRKRRISPEQRAMQIARLRASAGRAPSATGTRLKARLMISAVPVGRKPCGGLCDPLHELPIPGGEAL